MPPPPPDAGRRIGPYLVLEELGRGGMGAVYRARHGQTGAEHAVKVTSRAHDDEASRRRFARFRREMEALARIASHPGIVGIHACGDEGGRPWCAMELVDGESLGRRLERDGPLAPEDAARLVAAVARSVEHVHRHGIVHRDLKPENVIIDARTEEPRVVDFGLAYDAFSETLTRTGELLGTPAFMAPEQVARGGDAGGREEGIAEIGPATDVYGLGAVLYAALTGRGPFSGSSFLEILNALLHLEPEDPHHVRPEVPRELAAVARRALEKAPARRYASAGELADDLERWLRGDPTLARPSGWIGLMLRWGLPAAARARRRRVAAFAALVGLGAVVIGAAWVLSRRAEESSARRDALAEARGRLDEAFAAACAGDLAALAAAPSLLDRVEVARQASGAPDDPAHRTRREVLGLLRSLADGDEVRVRAIDLSAEPWSAHRQAIVRVLLAAGRTRGLGIVLEREPALAEEAAGPMATALAAGTVEPSPRLVDRVVGVLEGRADALPTADARRANADLRARILGRRLEAVIADLDDELGAELTRLLERLLGALGDGGASPRLSSGTVERLVARATRQADDLEAADVRSLGLLLQATLELLPTDDERARRVVDGLQRDLALSIIGAGAMTAEHAFEVGIILERVNALPVAVRALDPVAPASDRLEARMDEVIARGARPHELVELLVSLEVLAWRAEGALRRERHVGAGVKAAVLLGLWRAIDAILAREWGHHDVPGVVLARVAWLIARGVRTDPERSPEPRQVELVDRLLEIAPEDAGAGPTDATPRRVHALLERLFEASIGRDVDLPVDRRSIEPNLAFTKWLANDWERRLTDRPVALVLDALRRVPQTTLGELVTGRSRASAAVDELVLLTHRVVRRLSRGDTFRGPGRCPLGVRVEELATAVEAVRPEYPTALQLRAAHLAVHDVDAAIAALERAITHADASPAGRHHAWRPIFNATEILLAAGRVDDARAFLSRDPGPSFDQHRERAFLWRQIGDDDREAADLARARELEDR